CGSCQRIDAGQHPDVVLVEPDTSKARWTIKIEQVRDITRQVRYSPYEGRRRVVIIDHAEALTIEGANAFLKTLEEPTGDTIFILITPQPHRLLDTIRSRCQLIRFAPLDRSTVHALLITHGVDAQLAEVAAGYSEGSLARALELCEEGALESRRSFIEHVLDLSDADVLAVLDLAQHQAKRNNQELQSDLDALKVFYRDVVILRSGASQERLVNTDLAARTRTVASRVTVEDAIHCIEAIDSTQNRLRRYIDARLLMEQLLLKLADAQA
ncbi:MAG: DNA polymerase III subunit delta' C-terminal domain-containing protein, partial [Myxococcota bacterium]